VNWTLLVVTATYLAIPAAAMWGASVGALARAGMPGPDGLVIWWSHGAWAGILAGVVAGVALLR